MKNALILHGTNGSSQENWFPWLKQQLEEAGYTVWVPDLPGADAPNLKTYNKFIFTDHDFKITPETILIGHSSGAMAILGLLEALPENFQVKASYLVGAFKNDLGWEALKAIFAKPFDFEKIKHKSKAFYFIHSDNDPYCPLDHAEFLNEQLGGKLIVMPGQKHFSVGTYGEEYREFPELAKWIIDGEMPKGS